MESFDKYVKTLDDFLVNIDFIYSGDVINSTNRKFYEKINHSSFSSSLIRNIMIEIYESSVKKMIEESEEIIVHRNSFLDIHELMDRIPINTKILFYSNNSNLNLNLGSHIMCDKEDGFLPSYFIRRFKLMSHNREVSAYYCPEINDDLDDCHFYLVDKPIQSMVWALQNLDYKINKGFSTNEHIVTIPFYNCNFKSYRVKVVNTQKLRNDKINSILDGN